MPPLDSAGQPDTANFPAPPLFVLGGVNWSSYGLCAVGAVGVDGVGNVFDGFGGSAGFAHNLPQYAPPTGAIGRKILSGTGARVTVTLSPGGSVSISRTMTGDDVQGSLALVEHLYPITLASPNPLTNPLLGDGTNQYVYETSQPTGQLTVPASVYVPGATTAETTFLLPHVALYVSPAMQTGAQPFDWVASGAGMYVNTRGTRPGYTTPWPFGDFCYLGLPSNNSYFGNHQMAMKVDGTTSQKANYQLFYTATASNYPQAELDHSNYGYYLPNWFNYFEQVFPNTTTYDPKLLDLTGKPFTGAVAFAQCAGHYDTSVIPNRRVVEVSISKMMGSALTVGNAPPQGQGIPVFEVSPSTNYLDYIGQLYVKGVYSYLYVDGHEQEHIALQTSNDCFQPSIVTGSAPPNPPKDTDGDWIPDSVEAKYHLNPKNDDTTGYYNDTDEFPEGNNYQNGDTEAICDIAGLHAVVSHQNAWQQDWSDAGVQYGLRSIYFPYEYAPTGANQTHSNSLPSSAKTSLP